MCTYQPTELLWGELINHSPTILSGILWCLFFSPVNWSVSISFVHLSQSTTKHGCPVWPESSLWVLRVVKDSTFLQADSDDSDQTGQMPRLIWVFAECISHFVGFVTLRLIYWFEFKILCMRRVDYRLVRCRKINDFIAVILPIDQDKACKHDRTHE